jgi:hypothetical protein
MRVSVERADRRPPGRYAFPIAVATTCVCGAVFSLVFAIVRGRWWLQASDHGRYGFDSWVMGVWIDLGIVLAVVLAASLAIRWISKMALGKTLFAVPAANPRRAARIAATVALVVLGLAGSAWCGTSHICMAGHMAHPPYPAWHFVVDASWTLSLVGAAALACTSRAASSLTLVFWVAFLLSYRYVLGSAGGQFMFPL